MTKEQIETEAQRRYLKGSASYYAFIIGAEYVLDNETDNQDNRNDPD
jgi:hypothetical protein